ncbi:unnamed protein product [Arctogadus glacialis]
MILGLAEELRPFLERPTRRHGALPVVVQLTNALRLFAKGDFQSEVADIVANERTPQDMRYNQAHKKCRARVERLFGVWKSRWRCHDMSGGYLQYSPEKLREGGAGAGEVHWPERVTVPSDQYLIGDAVLEQLNSRFDPLAGSRGDLGLDLIREVVSLLALP